MLSLPFTLRYQLAFDAPLTAAVLDVFIRSVFAGLRRAAARAGIADAQCGAITAIQRFGSALNANVHFHSLVLDGVFSRPAPGAAPVFHPLPAPTDEEIAQILEQIHERVTRLLRRCGRLPEDPSPTDPVAEQMPLLAGYAAASIQERIATGPARASPCAGCAPPPRWWTGPSSGAPVWRASRSTPTSPCPRTPASNSSTCAATCCARPWPRSD